MNAEDKAFWQSLDVSTEDIMELGTNGSKPVQKLLSRLKDPGWLEVINDTYNKNFDTLKEAIEELYSFHKNEYYTIFAITEFCSIVDNPVIKERLPEKIRAKYEAGIAGSRIGYESLLLPIMKQDRNVLLDMFYEVVFSKPSRKTYRCDSQIDAEEILARLDRKEVEAFFSKLMKDRKIKRQVKLWWIKSENGKTRIALRLETTKRKSIHQVSTNTFIKMAGDRLMVISDKGNTIEVSSKERDAIARWVGMLLTSKLKEQISYSQQIRIYESDKVSNFIQRLREEQVKDMAWTRIEFKNASVANSPIIAVESSNMEPVNESVKDLETKHNLPVTSKVEDILNVNVMVKGRSYKLKIKTHEGKTNVLFDNKNLAEKEKDEVERLLDKAILEG